MENKFDKLEKELEAVKRTVDEIRLRRRELMYRLNDAGFTQQRIAEIYGCSQPFVAAEISAYKEQGSK